MTPEPTLEAAVAVAEESLALTEWKHLFQTSLPQDDISYRRALMLAFLLGQESCENPQLSA